MANVKITELTELASVDLVATDVVPIVDIDINETKKISLSNAILSISANGYSANDYITFSVLSDNINAVSANVDSVEARRIANTFYTYDGATVTASANLYPAANGVYTLGAEDAVWAEAYFGPSSIFIGTIKLSQANGGLRITDENNVSVTLDTSLGNVTQDFDKVSSNVDAVEARRDANTFYETNTHSVSMSANLVSDAQSNLGSTTERWSNAYADTLNLGSFELEQTQTSNVSVGTAAIFSRNKNSFNSAKLIVNIEDLTYGQYQSSEILLVQDTVTVKITEYAIVHTSTHPIANFDADFDGDNVRLLISAQSSDNIVTVLQFVN